MTKERTFCYEGPGQQSFFSKAHSPHSARSRVLVIQRNAARTSQRSLCRYTTRFKGLIGA